MIAVRTVRIAPQRGASGTPKTAIIALCELAGGRSGRLDEGLDGGGGGGGDDGQPSEISTPFAVTDEPLRARDCAEVLFQARASPVRLYS